MKTYRMVFMYHEIFGVWFVPNIKAIVPHERGYFFVKTNSMGMRSSREYDIKLDSGISRRILVFGDSYTAGDGVNNEQRFTDLLEASEEELEVLNFGLSGSGVDQQLLIYEHLGQSFGGDTLLLCFSVEDINRIPGGYRSYENRVTGEIILVPKPYFTIRNGNLQLHHVPVPRERFLVSEAPKEILALQTIDRSRFPKSVVSIYEFVNKHFFPLRDPLIRLSHAYKFFHPYPQYDSADHPDSLLMKAILKRFADLADSRKVVLAPLPTFHCIEKLIQPNYLEYFHELAEEDHRFQFVNLLPYFHKLPSKARHECYYARDYHFTPLGHSLIAKALHTEFSHILPRKEVM